MVENGLKQGSQALLRAALEQHLEDGLRSTNALVTLLSANKYAMFRDGLESIIDALAVMETMQQDLYK